jgi:hypothetical protein
VQTLAFLVVEVIAAACQHFICGKQFDVSVGQIGGLVENNATLADPSSKRLHSHHHSTAPVSELRTIELKAFRAAGFRERRAAQRSGGPEGGLERGQPGPLAPWVRAGAAVTRTPRASRLSRGLPKKETSSAEDRRTPRCFATPNIDRFAHHESAFHGGDGWRRGRPTLYVDENDLKQPSRESVDEAFVTETEARGRSCPIRSCHVRTIPIADW